MKRKINYKKRTTKIARICKELRELLCVDGSTQSMPRQHKKAVSEYAIKNKLNPDGIWAILN